jgi:hypothetical protein
MPVASGFPDSPALHDAHAWTTHPMRDDAWTTAPAPAQANWHPLLRVGFRFCFIYFLLWILLNGNATVWGAIPVAGNMVANWLWKPLSLLAVVVGHHLFHLTGREADWTVRASGDTALDWILTGLYVVVALLGTVVWSVLDRRGTAYPKLLAWLRFGLRLALGIAMLNYGFAKVFPFQMPKPYLPVLNEPLGQVSPMTLLWTLIGSNPYYEMVCGAAEVTGGLLILFRRTALLGALLTAFVMTNVVLYNFFFDVPVKIFALHLLMGAIFVTLPDAPALWRFFWRHEPAAPSGPWVPPAERKAFRVTTRVVEIAFLVLVVGQSLFYLGMAEHQIRLGAKISSPLQGGWQVVPGAGGEPWLTAEKQPVTEVYVEQAFGTNGRFRGEVRGADGELWRSGMSADPTKHTFTVAGSYTDPRS